MGVASALYSLMLCFPPLLCVVVQACTHVVSNRTTVFPFGLNSICETNNFSITQIPRALQVVRLFHLCELTARAHTGEHTWKQIHTRTHTHTPLPPEKRFCCSSHPLLSFLSHVGKGSLQKGVCRCVLWSVQPSVHGRACLRVWCR